jgi:hypothetical protein
MMKTAFMYLMNNVFMEYLDKFIVMIIRWYIGLLQE